MNLTKPKDKNREEMEPCAMADVPNEVLEFLIARFKRRLQKRSYGGYEAGAVSALEVNDSNAQFYAHENGREFHMRTVVDGRPVNDAFAISNPQSRSRAMVRREIRNELRDAVKSAATADEMDALKKEWPKKLHERWLSSLKPSEMADWKREIGKALQRRHLKLAKIERQA